jgi:hypothetical protein
VYLSTKNSAGVNEVYYYFLFRCLGPYAMIKRSYILAVKLGAAENSFYRCHFTKLGTRCTHIGLCLYITFLGGPVSNLRHVHYDLALDELSRIFESCAASKAVRFVSQQTFHKLDAKQSCISGRAAKQQNTNQICNTEQVAGRRDGSVGLVYSVSSNSERQDTSAALTSRPLVLMLFW